MFSGPKKKRHKIFLMSWYCNISYCHRLSLMWLLRTEQYLSNTYCSPLFCIANSLTFAFKLLGHYNIQVDEKRLSFQHRRGERKIHIKGKGQGREKKNRNSFTDLFVVLVERTVKEMNGWERGEIQINKGSSQSCIREERNKRKKNGGGKAYKLKNRKRMKV